MSKYKIITTQSDLEKAVPEIMKKLVWGVDTETTGLDPHKDKVILLQIGDKNQQYVIDTRKVNPEPLRGFLESETHKKILHNSKFDYKMIKGSFGIDVEGMRDTMLAEKILTNGKKKFGFGLADILKERLNVELSKDERVTFQNHVGDFTESQLRYAANDVVYLTDLYRNICDLILKDGLERTLALENACVSCIGDMEFAGMLLDKEKWEGIMRSNAEKAETLRIEMDDIAKDFLPTDLFGNVFINYGSPDQVLELLQRMNIKVEEFDYKTKKTVKRLIDSTNDAVLKKIKNYPVIDKLKKWRSLMIRVNTFGQAFLSAIHPATGRVHFELDQLGAETGRVTSHKRSPVNPLNIPRDKEMRSSFIAPPDYLVGTYDYSGCELRIWAHLSQDLNLLAPMRRGEDLHCYAASKLFGVPVTKSNENKGLRTPAKAMNFGIIYGMGPSRLYWNINGQGYPMTMEETKKLYYKYTQDEFRDGIKFLRDAGEDAIRDGYCVNAAGRRRYWRLPDPSDSEKFPMGLKDEKYIGIMEGIKREAGNFKIQSMNVEMTKEAMVEIRKYKKKNKVRTEFMNQVYDEIVTITHKDDAPDFYEAKKRIMIAAGEKWVTSVPIEVEGEVTTCWTK